MAAAEPERTHVPLGADVELYYTIADWAPAIAGFQRFDVHHDTPGAAGRPGVKLAELHRGDAVLDSYLFVVEPFDTTASYVQGYLACTGVDGYVQSFSVDQLNDWQGYGVAVAGEGLFGVRDPLVFHTDSDVRFYVGDNQEEDPHSTQGWVVLVLRVLPAAPGYPP